MKHLNSIILLLVCASSSSHAASVEWRFTNSGEVWGNNETVVLEAVLLNTGLDALELGNVDTGIGGAILSWGTFPASASNRDYRYYHRYSGILVPSEITFLQPDESIDFVFGEFDPQVIIESGYYEIRGAGLVVNSVAYTYSDNLFSATVVPIPASALLFGSGLACLLGLARNRKNNKHTTPEQIIQ